MAFTIETNYFNEMQSGLEEFKIDNNRLENFAHYESKRIESTLKEYNLLARDFTQKVLSSLWMFSIILLLLSIHYDFILQKWVTLPVTFRKFH